MQYSRAQQKGSSNCISAFLGDIPCKKWAYNCSGVKHCQYLEDDIRTLYHFEVPTDFWPKMKAHRERGQDPTEPDILKKRAGE